MSENEDKLALVRGIGQVVMTWVAFIVTGLVTLIFLGFFIYCVITERGTSATMVTGVLDGFLLVLLSIIFKNLFPGKKQD